MIVFYLIALLPIVIGGILWLKSHRIIWQEYLASSVIAFLMAGVFHLFAISGMTNDVETLSGKVIRVEHHPKWVEEWEELHVETYPCGTDEDGNTTYCTRTYYTTEYDTHPEHWECLVDFGVYEKKWEIAHHVYLAVRKEFGDRYLNGGKQNFNHGGKYYRGDQNLYITPNDTGTISPVTDTKSFENRIKAAPSVFSFCKVPTNVFVYDWPRNNNPWESDRVLGTAKKFINKRQWDNLNAELGPVKKVNLIIIGFESRDTSLAQYQEAKFVGGKKNDLVTVILTTGTHITFARCFGWTEKDLVKRNIESYIVEKGINTNFLDFLKREVIQNYELKDWSKFDYITVEPNPAWYYWYIFFVLGIQGGLWIYFHKNEFSKLDITKKFRYN